MTSKLALTPVAVFVATLAAVACYAVSGGVVPVQLWDFAKLSLGAALVQTPAVATANANASVSQT